MRRAIWISLATACRYVAPLEDVTDPDGSMPGIDGSPGVDTTVTTDGADPGPWLTGFTYRRQITINRTTGTTTLADFPVGIVIPSDSAIAMHALSSGGDLVITGSDKVTPINSELAGYTSATGATELWARVSSLPVGVTTLFLYYGGAATSTNPNGVWTSQFRGVWHLSAPSGSLENDSTGAGQHALDQATQTAQPAHATGIAGFGLVHDGVDDMVAVADPADGSLDFGTNSFSYEIWVNATANLGAFDQPFYKGGTTGSLPGYCMMLGTSDWSGKVHDGSSFRDITFSATPLLGAWHHLAVVIDRTAPASAQGYLDGVRTTNIALPLGSLSSGEKVQIGRGSNGAQFSGMTDEARIVSGALTADWIAAEHENLARAGFLTVASEQSL